MTEITLPLIPNRVQRAMDRLLDSVTVGAVFKIHRQAGKTTLGILRCIWEALFSRNPFPRTAYVCEHLTEARRNGWDYLQRLAAPIPDVKFNQTLLTADFPSSGGRVSLYGADDPGSLRGTHHDLVVLGEFARMNPSTLPEVVMPTLVQRQGKVACIGTPLYRHDPLCTLYDKLPTLEGWGRLMVKASESGLLSPEQLAAQRAVQTPEQHAREFECEPSAVMDGSIFGAALDRLDRQGRIGHVPHRAGWDVDTCWDLGYSDATCIWFAQRIGPAVHLINFHQGSGAGIEHYIRILRERSEQSGYRFGRHYGPHDTLQGSIQTGRSLADVAAQAGLRFDVVKRGPVEVGIQETRKLLEISWIDGDKCQRGLEALQAYRRTWDEPLRMFSEKPVHDWSSHPCDALRTGAVGGLGQSPVDPSKIATQAVTEWNVWDPDRAAEGGEEGYHPTTWSPLTGWH